MEWERKKIGRDPAEKFRKRIERKQARKQQANSQRKFSLMVASHEHSRMKKADQKRRRKDDKRNKLLKSAYSSGNAHLYLKRRVIAKLKESGQAEKVFNRIDTDGNGS